MTTRVTAVVPAHLTLLFSVYRDDDPLAAGSRGAGIVIDEGVRVHVEPGDRSTINGHRSEMEPVVAVRDELGVTAAIEIETSLPIGAGFGLSGAASLGVALAANEAFGLARTEDELVAIAHAAEVEAGTGLGDVVSQARGGVPIRREPGAPGLGAVDAIPTPQRRIEFVSRGELSTVEVLAGDTAELSDVGERQLEAVLAEPTLERLFEHGNRFALETGLATAEMREIMQDVAAAGGHAAMGLLGRTVVALDTGLSDAGYDPTVTTIDTAGPRLVA